MMTAYQCMQYLLSTPTNHTSAYLADHLEQVSDDMVSDFLRTKRVTARRPWHLVQGLMADVPEACLIRDDRVYDTRFSALVKHHYSGAAGGLVRGMDIVNLVHSSGLMGDFYPIDERIYAPDTDGTTQNDHFRDMLPHTICDKQSQAKTVLFTRWNASVDNLKFAQRLGLRFFKH